jgi:methylated-DNA-protein-cysteine methyltransferase-like protein
MVARRRTQPLETATVELGDNRNDRVWAVVKKIPAGHVATYGQVAALAGIPGPSGARQVGYALAALDHNADVPWHRVINAKGEISPRANPDAAEFQRLLLEDEGIGFDHRQHIDLARYAWQPER